MNENSKNFAQRRNFTKPDRAEYQEYLQSERWAQIRERVLLRDRGICQGCLNARASEVHHTRYDHIFNEFMFELIALCGECHERLHGPKPAVDGKPEKHRVIIALERLEKAVRSRTDKKADAA